MSARSFDFNKNAFPQIKEYAQTLRDIRRDFHKNPEIGLVTPQTSGKIASLLRSFGVDEVHEGIGGCGVVGVVRGARPGSLRVGLRADIDALPLAELSSHDHVSQIGGCMHACGHDGHAAVLLGAAKYLAETRDFPGEVVLIFQPGEEGWSGAKHMIDDGLFDRFPVAEVYALHNSSALEPGKIALNYGAMQAAADAFTITVKGKGGHASRPQMNHDPVLASAHVIVALQSIVSREVDPLETAVVSCCSLQAGDPRAQSVCPETCQIVGTARTFSPEVRDLVEKRIGEISACIAAGLGCEAQTKYERFYPPVINTPAQAKILADIAADLVGEENVDRSYPRMAGGEDFAFMLEKVPGAYIRIGQGGAPAHNPYFDYNDDVTPLAATLLAAAAEQRLHALNGPPMSTSSQKNTAFSRFWDSDLIWKFRHAPVAIICFMVTLGMVLSAMFAGAIAPYNPFDLASFDLSDAFLPPAWMEGGNWKFVLGTDDQGRDMFSAILYGLRVSLEIGLSSVLISIVIGVSLGLISGYAGGMTDTFIMRFCDVMLSFPAILLALLIDGVIRAILPESVHDQAAYGVLIFAISLSGWVRYARTVRGATLTEKKRDYVQAAQLFGVSSMRIMFTHILPNVMGPVLVLATVQVATAIITEATLSFLGVGVPPTTPSLGTLIRVGNEFLFSGEWWLAIFPGVALILFVLTINLLGDWLRDALNPKLQ